MAREKLSGEDARRKSAALKDWKTDGEKLNKRFEFANFDEALDFVNKVGVIAKLRDHHPDVKFGWGYAEIELTTHDTGGLTHNDFDVASKIDEIS